MLVVRGGMKLHMITRCLGLWREVAPQFYERKRCARRFIGTYFRRCALV